MALRGRMDLSSYDRLFPSQNALPAAGGVGNLLAAPLHGRARKEGATVFLDVGTLEPHEDQWAYLSTLHRLSPREVDRLATQLGPVRVGVAVDRLTPATATRTRPQPSAVGPGDAWFGHRPQHRRSDPSLLGHPQARGVDGEPGLLRPAETTVLDLGHSAVPAQL